MGSVSSGFCWTLLTPTSQEIGQTNIGNFRLGQRGGVEEEAIGLNMGSRVNPQRELVPGTKIGIEAHIISSIGSNKYLVEFSDGGQAIIPESAVMVDAPAGTSLEFRVNHD